MGNRKFFVLIPLILTLLLISDVKAAEGAKANVQVNIDAKGKIVKNNEKEGVQVKGEEFKIDGTVSTINVAENSFVVAGRTIIIDPVKVKKFSQKGVLAIGARVKVEGVVVDGKSYAEDINVIGTGQGKFQIKVDQAENEISVKVRGAMNQLLNFFKSIMVVLTTRPA